MTTIDGTFARMLATVIIATALQAAATLPAAAQESGAPRGALEEITVTAQRRAESVQSVPIAITAFTADELEQRNVTDTLDVLQYVPNVIAHNNTGLASANAYYIRGLGGTESLATADPAVGTYVDEIYISRQSANNLSLFDVERVEVLRGPQGTLFGRNTTGGAVSVVLAPPSDELGGFAEVGVGSWNERAVRASVDLPVTDRFLTKVSGYWNEDDGYAKNITTGEDVNNEKARGARIAARALFGESARWDVAALHTKTFSANIVNFECNPASPSNCDDRYVSTGLRRHNGGQNQLAPLNVANGKGNLPLGAETRFTLLSSNFEFDLGGVTLTSITGYVRTEQDFLIDFFDGRPGPTISFGTDPVTGLPTRYNVGTNVVLAPPVRGFSTGGFVISNIATSDQFTQEIKATGSVFDGFIDYVSGVFYYDERNTTDFADTINTTGTPALLADRIVRNSTEALAGYAQFDFNFGERWKATAGVRYTDEKKEYAFSDNRPICAADPVPSNCIDSRNFESVDIDLNPATPNVRIPLDQRVKLWTPRFALNYQASEDLLLFASATRGFKSGAQAARATAVRQLLPVGPEKVWSYELGGKSEWFDRRLRLNVTAFLQDTEDFQAGTAFVNPSTGALSFVTRNLADMENRGVEVELVARPIAPLTLSLAAGYQDIEFKIDSGAPPVDQFGFLSPAAQQLECRAALAGQPSPLGNAGTALARAQGSCSGIITNTGELAEPVRAPEVTVSAGVAYEIAIAQGEATLTPAVNVQYTSDQEVGTNNLSGFISDAGVANFAGDGRFVLGSFSEEHTIVNANIALRDGDDRWLASISCDNCFDQAYPQATLSNFSYLNPPRSWALRVRWNF